MTKAKKKARTDMRTYLDIFRLKFERRMTDRQIALTLNIGRSTVNNILTRFRSLQLEWPLPDEVSLEKLDNLLMPGRNYQSQRVLPDWLKVHKELTSPLVTKQLLWQEYQAEYGNQALGYTQFCEHYRRWLGKQRRSMRQLHKAGEKLFIDFCGPTVRIVDPTTGEYRKAAIFVASMGASNYTYIEACEGQDLESWLLANRRCLEFLGGVPQLLIPDNLKSGVNQADRYEPQLNDSYRAFSQHYGCPVIPARPRKPQDKGKVESAVLVVERWVLARLRHITFHSLAALNQAIRSLNKELNERPMKSYDGLSRAELFKQIDAPALAPLPEMPYEYAQFKLAKVGKDYHVAFDNHWYSVPHALVGERVELMVTQRLVQIHYRGNVVATHIRSKKRYQHTTEASHMPVAHAVYKDWTPERIHRWAASIGKNTALVVEHIERSKAHVEQAQRSCLGLLSLQKRYSSERLERACGIALEQQHYAIRFIRNILANGRDSQSTPEPATTPTHHINVRGAHYYQ